ncbi:MAG: lysostaphin resistance A-like protein [Deltaproteobacteria bacterium]
MRTTFRILGLILIAQLMSFLFLFIFNDLSLDINNYSEKLSLEIVKKIGVDLYVLISQLMSIFIPSLIFLVIFHIKSFRSWIKLYLPGNSAFFVYGIMLLFFSYPLIQFSAVINQKLPLAQWLNEENQMAAEITKMILDFQSPYDLIIRILLVALLPAVGEELFFRAGLQNELIKGFRNRDLAIITASLIFSAFHLQFDGFLPRFFLGLIMGYLYYWSSSIYVPMLVHFANNLMLIVSAYLTQDVLKQNDMQQIPEIPIFVLLISAIAVFIVRIKLINLKSETIL